MKTVPDFSFEKESGFKYVAGVDEAGRGPLCGPVVAGAVIFPEKFYNNPPDILITDSKKMSKVARAKAFDWIKKNTIWAVGECSPIEIDELNILWASMLAMRRAVESLSWMPEFCLIDGNRIPEHIPGRAIVKGDLKSLSIAAASIVAKETRDKIMLDLSADFPQYGWEKNAGYPTPAHLIAIKKYGINNHYRKCFKPIKELL